ncbi:MAG: formimidoylglutamate deiminase [Pseudomonadota bacterium]
MTVIAARQALFPDGWRKNAVISIGDDGRIDNTNAADTDVDHKVGVLLPALSNVHSHSFQRAMAGLAERRGSNPRDDFWTWRQVMYRFLDLLSPEDIGDIAAFAQMEMLEAGYAAQAEFHYLHHQPDGTFYSEIDELSGRLLDAAQRTGIGLTHLPVLYMQGGLDGRALEGGQLRFGCNDDHFAQLFDAISTRWKGLPKDYHLGVAPHSLRAVPKSGLEHCLQLIPEGPIHLHAAEQLAEVDGVQEALGARPIAWLLDHMPIDERWCVVHATHMNDQEVQGLASSGAVVGVCPITEANLGDGTFRAAEFLTHGGFIGIGTDSNVNITLSGELRMLEVSQRLRDRRRAVLTSDDIPSNGRFLYNMAAAGGVCALKRDSGRIEAGVLADLVSLDDDNIALAGLSGDTILDTWIFGAADQIIRDVWSAGRHVVREGRHIQRDSIKAAYKTTIKRLRGAL